MLRVSVAGASGYSGGELVRWLLQHPEVELALLTGGVQEGREVAYSFTNLEGFVGQRFVANDWQRLAKASDVVFLALPHGVAMEAAPILLDAGVRVIDIGADFRLEDPSEYKRWYGIEHACPELLAEAVYGLPELQREAIRAARLVANPGCYPTAVTLALLPLLGGYGRLDATVVVDAKSGVSGAGRKPASGTHFGEVNENVRPYNVGAHRHTPEMEQTLVRAGAEARIFFSPHLIPMTRGILAACYLPLGERSPDEVTAAFTEMYGRGSDGEPFVRVLADRLPETKATLGSNYCDVAVRIDEERDMVVAFSALDNLVKGAAGQAIQNMNLMCGYAESLGLLVPGLFP